MSVHTERGPDGRIVYKVRWRDGGRATRNRARTFDMEDDAVSFDRRVRRLKQTGDPAILADEITLRQYVYGEWWPNYAERQLALSTQESHSIDLELRIIPRLGELPLTQIRPRVVERFAADLERDGTGRATIVSTLAVLQGVMKRTVHDYNLPSNAVQQIDKPSQRRDREPILVTVEQVEHMRAWCLRRDDLRSATLLSLLAYAGPRPESEDDPLNETGTRIRARDPPTRPLGRDLGTWRKAASSPPDSELVIPNRSGQQWVDYDWDNWRERTFRAAAAAAGLPAGEEDGANRVRPRDLRSSSRRCSSTRDSPRSTSPTSSATAS